MAPLRFSGNYTTTWECSVCTTTRSGRDTPWDTLGSGVICEICITLLFDEALHWFDVEWPARWGGEELDPRDFASFFSNKYINTHLTKHAEVAERRRNHQPELLEGMKLGRDYQVCPRSKTLGFVKDSCVSVLCRCLANFCFRCGMEVKDIDLLDVVGLWNERDGCKRYRSASPNSGSEQIDGGAEVNGSSEEELKQVRLVSLEKLDAAALRFNAAMQSANAQDQVLLGRFLESEKPLSQGEVSKIWAMMSARPRDREAHGWMREADYREQCDMEFLHCVEASRGQERATRDEFIHVLEGSYLLPKPIGEIFDMSRLKTRLAACTWLADRITSAGAMDKHINAAIFEIHDGPDRDIAFRLLRDTLKDYMFILPHHTISFDFLGDLVERRNLGVFVQVQERSNPQADEFTDRVVGDLNALCGIIVSPSVDLFVVPDRPVGKTVGKSTEYCVVSPHGGLDRSLEAGSSSSFVGWRKFLCLKEEIQPAG